MALIKPLDEHQVPKDQRFTPEKRGIFVSSSGYKDISQLFAQTNFYEQFWTQKLPLRALLTIFNNDCKEIMQERQAY